MVSIGLPTRLEHYVSDLLSEIGLTSWRMYEEPNNTTIVLQFNGHLSTKQAHDSSDIRFRRKSTNSVKRDQHRARKYYDKKMKDKSVFM